MLDLVVESPIILSLVCAALAVVVVTAGYRSPSMTRFAIATPMHGKFPFRSFSRAAMVVFVVLINAASLFLAHRFPLGTDLIVAGFLLLLFAPNEAELEA